MFEKELQQLKKGSILSLTEIQNIFTAIFEDKTSEEFIEEFIKTLTQKGESASEFLAALFTIRKKQIPLTGIASDLLVDTCGTGGDGQSSFNVSTCAALIAAAAGVKIAKHGNRAFSSKSGSADVLEKLGVAIHLNPQQVQQSLDQFNFVFLFAPDFNPVLAKVAAIRKKLGYRTLFNKLGPLLNPLEVKRQVLGVAEEKDLKLYQEVLEADETLHSVLVHAEDGSDEISLKTPTRIIEIVNGETISDDYIDPKKLGFNTQFKDEDLKVSSVDQSASLIESILKGEASPASEISILNAAYALFVSDQFGSLKECIQKCRDGLSSGKANILLQNLRKFNQALT